MQLKSLCLLLTLCSACAAAEAENNTHLPPFILDRSQNVFFEDYSVSTFTQNLFGVKNSFGSKQVVLGGMAELDLQRWQGDTINTQDQAGTYTHDTALYFTQTTFDVMANLTPWVTLFTTASLSGIGQGGESGNYLNLPYAFLLFGNIEQCPLYVYGGYNAISFGKFNTSGGWDYPLSSTYFQPQVAPGVSLGYQNKKINVSTTVFTDQVLYENHMVYNLLYQNNDHLINYGFGLGYLTHLDLNTTGDVNVNRNISKENASMEAGNVADLNGNVGYKDFSLSAEWLRGSEKVLMNHAKPIAFGTTLTYSPTLNDTYYSAGLSYSKTIYLKDVSTMLAGQDQIPYASVGLQNSWAASVTRNFFGDWFYASLNAQRDVTYDNKKTYTFTVDGTAYL
ncbi:MAG TPA: DUF3573 domain-containing protein [Gammaproteobacteria bacterium]|nr:DUF3573 domain-containing protein [Gammaproteobacteria bacterium]